MHVILYKYIFDVTIMGYYLNINEDHVGNFTWPALLRLTGPSAHPPCSLYACPIKCKGVATAHGPFFAKKGNIHAHARAWGRG